MPLRMHVHFFAIVAIGSTLCYSQVPDGIGCGVDKTCFFQPNGCWKNGENFNSSGCALGVTMADDGNGNATIEMISYAGDMSGVDLTYYGMFIAFGLSYDKWMGDDSVMNCVWSPKAGTKPRIILNYNTGKDHGGDYTSGIAVNQSTGLNDTIFWCRFQRSIVVSKSNPNERYVFPLNQPYYFLMTRGVADANSQTPKVHDLVNSINFPFVSYDKHTPIPANGQGYSDATGDHGWASTIPRTMQYHLVYAHAGLMMLGFWVFLGTGVIVGRYYKIFYPASPTICGKAAWFQVHRTVNSIGALLIITAFICIFVSTGHLLVDKNMGATYPHMILGITAVILVVLLPVGAIFRPHPGTPYRPLFRDFHFFFAFTAFALSFGCFVLASEDISKGGMTKDPTCVQLMYCVVAILGFINLLQTLNMRIYQAGRAIADSAKLILPEKWSTIVAQSANVEKLNKKMNSSDITVWLLHIMTIAYVVSTFSIAVYLIKTEADTGVKTLIEKFPCPCVS